jgi:hypothetical protein
MGPTDPGRQAAIRLFGLCPALRSGPGQPNWERAARKRPIYLYYQLRGPIWGRTAYLCLEKALPIVPKSYPDSAILLADGAGNC